MAGKVRVKRDSKGRYAGSYGGGGRGNTFQVKVQKRQAARQAKAAQRTPAQNRRRKAQNARIVGAVAGAAIVGGAAYGARRSILKQRSLAMQSALRQSALRQERFHRALETAHNEWRAGLLAKQASTAGTAGRKVTSGTGRVMAGSSKKAGRVSGVDPRVAKARAEHAVFKKNIAAFESELRKANREMDLSIRRNLNSRGGYTPPRASRAALTRGR